LGGLNVSAYALSPRTMKGGVAAVGGLFI